MSLHLLQRETPCGRQSETVRNLDCDMTDVLGISGVYRAGTDRCAG